ncbi:MAG: glycosyltransferase [Ferruginibacter sp.]
MKVSICVITYNHEQYIAEALESVLSQQTNFLTEIIIGEDYSTDGTREICKKFADKYAGIIKLIPAEKNVGMMKNFTNAYKACNGDYIAFIEGDDYWTDPLKLQKQIDFLRANPEYSACFHNVQIKSDRNGEQKEWVLHKELEKDTFDTEDLLGPWFIASPSFVFVNYPDFEIPDWFYKCAYGDLPIMLLLTLRGKFKYLPEVMAVYRLHDRGFTTKHHGYDKIIIMTYIYQSFNIHTKYKYVDKIREAVIYEITRHIPKDIFGTKEKQLGNEGILRKVYGKVKDIMRNEKV